MNNVDNSGIPRRGQEVQEWDLLTDKNGYISDDGFIVHSDSEEEGYHLSDEESFSEDEISYNLRSKIGGKRKREDLLSDTLPSKKAKKRPNRFYIPQIMEEISSNQEKTIIGRDSELQQIINKISSPKRDSHPLLIGPPQVGKTSVVKKLAQMLINSPVPLNLKGRKIVIINCKGMLGRKFLFDFRISYIFQSIFEKYNDLSSKEPIFFFKDIDAIVQIDCQDFFGKQYLQSIFSNGFLCLASVSGLKHSQNVQNLIEELTAYRFSPVYINECSSEEAKDIARAQIKKIPLINKIKLPEESLDLAVKLADSHLKSQVFPMKAIHLIRQAATQAWTNNPKIQSLQPKDIASTLSLDVNIPPDDLVDPDFKNISNLKKRFEEQLIGQSYAIETVIKAIQRNRLGITDPARPRFTALLIGPTGVGKTECVKQLVNLLHYNFIRIDMSEYKENHTISRLIGSPPGYVGYSDKGSLTDKLIENPFSIVLLDEIEKAHPDVIQNFLQVFDDGRLTNGQGQTVDCSHAWFFMTSNLGAEEMLKLTSKGRVGIKTVMEKVEPYIHQHFTAEFINRVDQIIPFQSLDDKDYPKVVDVHLNRLGKRLKESRNVSLEWKKDVNKYFIDRYLDHRFGVRKMCRALEREVGDVISKSAAKSQKALSQTKITLSLGKKKKLTASF